MGKSETNAAGCAARYLDARRDPNGFGPYGIAGSVWQWVESKDDPTDLKPKARRVLRGIPLDENTYHLRAGAGYSAYAEPDQKRANIGFHVCRVAPIEKRRLARWRLAR